MKTVLAFLLLLSLLATSTGLVFGQGRPRRVGDQHNNNPQTNTPAPEAEPTSSQPRKPPVLGGNNYPNNRRGAGLMAHPSYC
jgi:hypothetical protein